MSGATAALATRMRICDPKPAYCPACWQAAKEGVTFVDFDAAFDGGEYREEKANGVIAYRVTADDLVLCETCVRQAAEVLGLKPELHTRQLREIRRLELEREHWKDYAKRLEAATNTRPEPVLPAKRR